MEVPAQHAAMLEMGYFSSTCPQYRERRID